MICAISKDRLIKNKYYLGSVTGKIFTFWIKELLTLFQNSSKKYFICDNSTVHHVKEIEYLFDDIIHEIMYLSPYSPQLNPIESLFSKWKIGVKRHRLTSRDNLLNRIKESQRLITVDDCQHWIKHSSKYLSICLKKEPLSNELL